MFSLNKLRIVQFLVVRSTDLDAQEKSCLPLKKEEEQLYLPNRPFAQILSGLERGHLAAAGPSPAGDFSVLDEQKAVFLVLVLDCSECDSSGLDNVNSNSNRVWIV